MEETFTTLALSATIAVVVAGFLRQRGWSIALPLIAVGIVVGVLPFGPSAPPDPEIVLVAILAPLVFGEALSASYLDLRRVSRPVLALAIGLVIATTFVVGAVGALAVGLPLAMAMALGAVLAPTDAVAVGTVARRAGLPRRLVSILEGESLVNDGTGLTALTVALAAAAAGSITVLEVGGLFVISVVGGLAVGVLGGLVVVWLARRGRDPIAVNALTLVVPFLLYFAAEQIGGSGILAVVAAALVIAGAQNADASHRGRPQSVALWRQVTFVLQALAFFLIGLEIPAVLRGFDETSRHDVVVLVPIVVVALIVTRFVFVFAMAVVANRVNTGGHAPYRLRGAALLSWAGARGPVSGLAAFSIPVAFATGDEVPYRDVILGVTFIVIVITLFLSLTIAPLARRLKLKSDDDEKLLRRVDGRLARAAIDRLTELSESAAADGHPLPEGEFERLREEAERRIEVASHPDAVAHEERAEERLVLETARSMVRAEQEELLRMRDDEDLPDAIVRPLLRQLDLRDQALRVEKMHKSGEPPPALH